MDSPITKKSRGSRPPFGMFVIIIIQQIKLKIKLHLGYKNCNSFTKVAFGVQKWLLVYKYLLLGYKNGFSDYKEASRFTTHCVYGFISSFFT